MNKILNKKINLRSFRLSHQLFFAQRLSLLLNSGISIVEAISIIKDLETSFSRKNIYEILIKNIEHGMSLSKSIKSNNINLNHTLITLIQNGEASGNLSESLMQAFNYLEKKDKMKKQLISSLIYPIFIMFATIMMTLFLILYIFPKIIPLFKSLDIRLPLITRIVQWFYYFSISYGFWMIFIFILFLFLIHFLMNKYHVLKYKFHHFILRIPIISFYIKIYTMSSICNIGETVLSSGRGVPYLLLFSKESIKNLYFKNIFNKLYFESNQGIALSTSLRRYKDIFPALLPDMCALGERTGNLALILGHCGRIFEQDIDNSLKRFSSLIEPILMIFMGIVVGSIALSIILPVYEITNHLSK